MSELIISLDKLSMDYALELAEKASGKVWGFKVNDLLLHYGAQIIYELRVFGKVMADPKLFDIPNTMHNGIQCLKTAGANIITVHCASGYLAEDDETEILAGVTCLTSMPDSVCKDLYGLERDSAITKLADIGSQYKYLVCSVSDLIDLDSAQQTICPGIRPSWYQEPDDQIKTATPSQAAQAGADLIVVGRPLTHSEDFSEALGRTLEELESLNLE